MVVNGTALRAAVAAVSRRHVLPQCGARLCASSRLTIATTAALPTARALSSILASGRSHHHSRRASFSTTASRPGQQQQSVPPISPPPPSPQQAEPDQHQQQKQQQSRRRTRRVVLFGAAFLLLGSTLGSLTRTALAPPDLVKPGTDEDARLLASIAERAAQLPLHKELSADPAWRSWAAYDSFTTTGDAAGASAAAEAAAASALSGPSLTSRAMSGSRGLAYQRIFHNPATNEVVSIVYLGRSIAGWPGVVHGGAIATVLDETLGRCAVRLFPARTGVTANLELDYKQPTRSEGFYIIRTRPMDHGDGGDGIGGTPGKDSSKSDRKRWVAGTLERLDGTVCVRAKALFVVPKGVKLAPIADKY
ncbi:acyl-coenzyme A thioesterase THEM4 [Microdochium nivale]|nr:acyl-coenzyme A thioesterase THEM4 [Microdochium nivale]